MAKKKKNKSLLPKRIAGVKVPKALRKKGLGNLLTSPLGVAILSEALLLAGGKMAGQDKPGSATRRLLAHPGEALGAAADGGADAAHLAGDASLRLADAITAGLGAFFATLRGDDAPSSHAPVQPAEAARKKGSAPGEPRAAH